MKGPEEKYGRYCVNRLLQRRQNNNGRDVVVDDDQAGNEDYETAHDEKSGSEGGANGRTILLVASPLAKSNAQHGL
ncbi:MAG: hypothetical protein R3D55_05075 [Chloroflexota bacterium]